MRFEGVFDRDDLHVVRPFDADEVIQPLVEQRHDADLLQGVEVRCAGRGDEFGCELVLHGSQCGMCGRGSGCQAEARRSLPTTVRQMQYSYTELPGSSP